LILILQALIRNITRKKYQIWDKSFVFLLFHMLNDFFEQSLLCVAVTSDMEIRKV